MPLEDGPIRWALFKSIISKKCKNSFSQLKEARQALQLSRTSIAEKMKLSEATLRDLEKSEANQTISLKNMRQVCEAMNCDLIYVVVHKSRKPFTRIIWEMLFEVTKDEARLFNCPRNFRATALYSRVCRKLKDQKIRKSLGWSRSFRN